MAVYDNLNKGSANLKEVAEAIETLGVEVPEDATLNDMADIILNNLIKIGQTVNMQAIYDTAFTISNANKVMTPYDNIELLSGSPAVFSVANGVFTALCDISSLAISLVGTTSLNAEGTSTGGGHNSTHQYCYNGEYTDLGQLAGGSTQNYSTSINLSDIKMGDTLSFHVSVSYAGATPYFVKETVTFDAII